MSEGVCDGVVSGIACVLPELIVALYGQGRRAAATEFDDAWRCLWDVVKRLDACPTPWGLKWIAEARGILPASFAQPLTEQRAAQGAQIKAWLEEWFPSAVKHGVPAA
jgi:4-hydroxy-tetrahydrodipicolinate synthase